MMSLRLCTRAHCRGSAEKNENENKDYLLDILDLHNVVGRGVQVCLFVSDESL